MINFVVMCLNIFVAGLFIGSDHKQPVCLVYAAINLLLAAANGYYVVAGMQ